jgi:hypothetical protein
MAISGRQWGLFAAGLLLGGAGVALLLGGQDAERKPAAATRPATAVLGAVPAAPAASAAAATTVTAEHRAACEEEPLLRAAGRADGQLAVPEATAGKSIDVAEKSIVAGKEVAAAGRPRDAEVAFLVACRIAAETQRPQTLADAKYNLARHYAQMADEPGLEAQRDKLRQRAGILYTAAHALFAEQLGASHEKTRFAANGLQALNTEPPVEVVRAPPLRDEAPASAQKKAKKQETPAAEVAKTEVAKTEVAKTEVAKTEVAKTEVAKTEVPRTEVAKAKVAKAEAARTEISPARPAARRSAPSFDCGKARSAAEKAICADEELAQSDRALGRLHSRAKANSPDAAEFQRRSDEAWRWRETNCGGDRECLREWYEQRREELAEAEEE